MKREAIEALLDSEARQVFADEWTKMMSGQLYDGAHEGFQRMLGATRRQVRRLNALDPDDDPKALDEALRELLGSCGEHIHVNLPFRCDYGCNIHVGENFFANFNLTVLDEGMVTIGDNAFIGPNVSIYTACHPLEAEARNAGTGWAEPVTIGNNVWIGGGVTILPGVTIGDGAVIGAGAVVTHDVEPSVVAAGNPARVIRRLS